MSETTQTKHPSQTDKIAAALITLFWVLLVGGPEIAGALATLEPSDLPESLGALSGVMLGGVLVYVILLKAIIWYHER